ncbi:MAG: hypothetical protein PSV16_05665 [Flavobacterium sp.]|nr:hypothetical protein [Flavobacterium sp.]
MADFFGGLMFLDIGLLNREGSEINLFNKMYRKVNSVFGIKFGKWNPLPKIKYISVFKTLQNQTVNYISATATVTNDIILLNLFYDRNKKTTAYSTSDKADAFDVAQHLAMALEIDIFDATERKTKWL